MTSEGPHRPGQEPDEVPPGGPAPYGDRPAQQDGGYGATAPDLGWAPPPPARPDASTSAWASQQGNPWGTAQATQQAESPVPGSQPPWLAQGDQREQPGQGWAPAGPSTSDQPAWATGEQANPAWPGSTTPDTAQPAEWTPNQSPAGQPADWSGGQPAGWGGSQQPEWASASRPDDQTPGWATAGESEPARPDWAQAEQPAPVRSDPPARATAQVPQPDAASSHRPTPDEPARSGGWQAEQQEPPAWATGQRREPAAGGWSTEQPAEAWHTGGDRPAQPDWATPQPAEAAGWPAGDAAAHEQPQWSPPAQERPATGWTPGEPAIGSARPGDSGPPPSWSPAQEPLPSRTAGERSSLTEMEPWAPGEAWGNTGPTEAASARPDAEPDPGRADEAPVYQPAPAPGISPANMVPLPPQEPRVPGASLAAAPPADYAPSTPFGGDQAGPGPRPGAEQPAGGIGWGQPESRHEDPQPPAEPVIPAPRTSPEATGRATSGSGVSASASVPLASRVMPPADHAMRPAETPAPQPRVYGRPAHPEPEEPAQERDDQPLVPRFEQAPEPRFGDREPPAGGPNAFAAAPASPAAPPAFPPGLPSFADAPPSDRPVNGVRPHAEPERPADPYGGPPSDPFGAPPGNSFGAPPNSPFGAPPGDPFGGAPGDPFGAPPGDPFGAPPGDPFGGAPDRPGGAYGAAARPEPGGDHTSAFPPPPQSGPPWGPGAPEPDQGRFDAFKPVAEPAPETPVPKVRNGRVLAAVLVAAALILSIPLGLLQLLGKIGGSDEPGGFNPTVGSCVMQSGESAVEAVCGESGSFTVVSKVESKDKCPDPTMPSLKLRANVAEPVLCLKDSNS